MKNKWYKVGKGLQARDHESRKYGKRFDRYIRARYMVDGKFRIIPFGYESEFAEAEKARIQKEGGSKRSLLQYATGELERLRANAKQGQGPTTKKEERELEEEKAKQEARARAMKERESITFGQYFTGTYYPIAKISKKQRSHEQELSHFNLWLEPVIGDMRFKDIMPLHLERVKRNLLNAPARARGKKPVKKTPKKQPRSPRMIQYVFATFRQCWNYARRDGIIDREWPGKSVKFPKVENQRMRFLTDEEGDLLLDGLKERSQQLHDVSLLSFDSGLRADEIFSLTWNRVDLEQKTIKVFDSKGKDRVVYLTDRAVDMLTRLPEKRGLVFRNRKGEQIKEISNSFDREVSNLKLNEGVTNRKDKLVFHSLRHSYASRLVSRGVDLYVVGQLMGHSDLTMTKRYAHLRPNTLKAAVKTLEEPENGKVVPLEAKVNY